MQTEPVLEQVSIDPFAALEERIRDTGTLWEHCSEGVACTLATMREDMTENIPGIQVAAIAALEQAVKNRDSSQQELDSNVSMSLSPDSSPHTPSKAPVSQPSTPPSLSPEPFPCEGSPRSRKRLRQRAAKQRRAEQDEQKARARRIPPPDRKACEEALPAIRSILRPSRHIGPGHVPFVGDDTYRSRLELIEMLYVMYTSQDYSPNGKSLLSWTSASLLAAKTKGYGTKRLATFSRTARTSPSISTDRGTSRCSRRANWPKTFKNIFSELARP
jgi:hypothetical protein